MTGGSFAEKARGNTSSDGNGVQTITVSQKEAAAYEKFKESHKKSLILLI